MRRTTAGPFVGASGQFLTNIMRNEAGINRQACLVGNVCQHRPPLNEISVFRLGGPEIQDGLAELAHDIARFDPHLCVLLGNTRFGPQWALLPRSATGGAPSSSRTSKALLRPSTAANACPPFTPPTFSANSPATPCSALISSVRGKRAPRPPCNFRTATCRPISTHRSFAGSSTTGPSGRRCSVDIEGTLHNGWPCVSICGDPTRSICIVWSRFSETEHARVLQSFSRLMFRANVPKVLQNQLYDNFVLSYGLGIPIRGVAEDTLIKGWSIYAELGRSLATQASVWTRQPHWKDDSMYGDVGEGLYRGCAMDSAVTLEICAAQDAALHGPRSFTTAR